MPARPFRALVAACALALPCLAQHHAPAEVPESVEELFHSRCLACHVPPDPRFAVERAWLHQVADTA